MTIQPCRTCYMAEGCPIRAEKRRAVRGLGLTAIKFKCDLLTDSLSPGQRVKADLQYVAYRISRDDGSLVTRRQTVDAIVMGWSREKVRIYVPYETDSEWWLLRISSGDPESRVHVVRVAPKQLRPQPGRVPVCRHCGLPGDAELEDWDCSWGDGCDVPMEGR